jgi:hypothetical protein
MGEGSAAEEPKVKDQLLVFKRRDFYRENPLIGGRSSLAVSRLTPLLPSEKAPAKQDLAVAKLGADPLIANWFLSLRGSASGRDHTKEAKHPSATRRRRACVRSLQVFRFPMQETHKNKSISNTVASLKYAPFCFGRRRGGAAPSSFLTEYD